MTRGNGSPGNRPFDQASACRRQSEPVVAFCACTRGAQRAVKGARRRVRVPAEPIHDPKPDALPKHWPNRRGRRGHVIPSPPHRRRLYRGQSSSLLCYVSPWALISFPEITTASLPRKPEPFHFLVLREPTRMLSRTGPSISRLFASGFLVGLITLKPVGAASQQLNPPDQVPNTGLDFFKPPENLFQLLYSYKTAPGSGETSGSIATVTTDTVNLRVDHRIDLSQQAVIALRSDLPILAKNPISSSNPDGDYLYGIGDADTQAVFIYDFDQRWAAGFGARVIAPTGGDTLGSGKWQIMPIMGFRYGLPELSSGSYFEPFARYDVSFAGDPSKRNISNLQLAPFLNLGLPEHWFVALYPSADIRINFGDPVTGQTGRLFLPFDARVGRNLTDHIALSLEIGVPIIKDYPVYNFKAEVRLNVTY